MLLFGARAPLLGDYVESCRRLERAIDAVVRLDAHPARFVPKSLVIDLDDAVRSFPGGAGIVCAFETPRRRQLADLVAGHGFEATAALVDPTAIVASSTGIGAGSFVNAGAIVGAFSRLGTHVVVNRGTTIGHHVLIDDFVSIGPGTHLTGQVQIGVGASLGAGVVVLPGVRIGEGAVVAAGAVVRRNVPDRHLAFGHPARLRPIGRRRFMDTEGQE
ncbi:MAG: acetyltransferase [Pseudomonadota bacterium]